MPNSRHKEAMLSPSLSRITNRIRSSITELSFHGIPFPASLRAKKCNPCVRNVLLPMSRNGQFDHDPANDDQPPPACAQPLLPVLWTTPWLILCVDINIDDAVGRTGMIRRRSPGVFAQFHPLQFLHRNTAPVIC